MSVLAALCAGLLVSLPCPAVAQPNSDAPDPVVGSWIERADAALSRGQSRRALRLIRRAVRRAPSDPRAALRLARLALPPLEDEAAWLREEPAPDDLLLAQEARSALAETLGTSHGAEVDRELQLRYAWALALTGELRAATETAARAMGRMDERVATLLRSVAAIAVARRNLPVADQAVGYARRADPVTVDLILEHAAIQLARGRATEAVSMLQEALSRRPDDVEARRDLAGALLAAGRPGPAVDHFSAIALSCPLEARCLMDLARASLEAGEAARAERAAARAVGVTTNDAEPPLMLAAARLAQGKRTQAAEAFRLALERQPRNLRAQRGLTALEE